MPFLKAQRTRDVPDTRHNLLAFVNPQPLPQDTDPCRTLSSLQDTQENFKNILQFYPNHNANRVLYGDKAVGHVLTEDITPFSVIYFATHAGANEKQPLESWIALAAGHEHDGRFKTPDVLHSRLDAELVILAACETGGGEITGDGVDGLSRAFIFAGARALLSSLWKVPEQKTLEIMYAFHKAWREAGASKGEALRRAQVEVKNFLQGQPELWSAFILIGEWR